ncbi:hypothetical protein [Vibrio cortegadensis]|uniref:hypothetical protein n=1 Tax=Vibrio cortegadensis TaxID=1328770 RepID=UPI00352D51A4
MSLEVISWVSVVDDLIKIAGGGLVGGGFSYLQLRQSQSFNEKSRKEERFYKNQDERKAVYGEFLSLSTSLLREYEYHQWEPFGSDAKEYYSLLNRAQMISPDFIRKELADTYDYISVSCGSNHLSVDGKVYSNAARSISRLQAFMHKDVTAIYSSDLT